MPLWHMPIELEIEADSVVLNGDKPEEVEEWIRESQRRWYEATAKRKQILDGTWAVARRLSAEEIVRDLANAEAPTEDETGLCVLCWADAYSEYGINSHDPMCPWRQAVGWLEMH